jgi:hypothetical protein
MDETNPPREDPAEEFLRMDSEFYTVPFEVQQKVVHSLFAFSQRVYETQPELTSIVLAQIYIATGIELILTNPEYKSTPEKLAFLLHSFDKFLSTALKMIGYEFGDDDSEDSESSLEYKIIHPANDSIN